MQNSLSGCNPGLRFTCSDWLGLLINNLVNQNIKLVTNDSRKLRYQPEKRIHLTCCLLHKNISAVKLFSLVYPCSASQFVVLKPAENIVVKWKEMHSPSLICLRTQHAALFLYVLNCLSSYPPFPSMINGTGAPYPLTIVDRPKRIWQKQ